MTNRTRMKAAMTVIAAALTFVAPAEAPYAFRERLEEVHRPGLRDFGLKPTTNEFVFSGQVAVGDADFADYLRVSMSVPAVATAGPMVVTRMDKTLRPREYEIVVNSSGVRISAADRRALHQAYYRLEDRMNLRGAPFLAFGTERRRMRFSPRMLHSGWGLDVFPRAHLRQMAHYGFDAILVFIKDVDTTQGGGPGAGVNHIVETALEEGLDTYLYSKVQGFAHPGDPEGAQLLRDSFGRVAAAHPKARGIVFVGESCQFPSRDPRVQPVVYQKKNLADPRPLAGWFPCRDYPDWLRAVKAALNEHAPEMEIVFWTYNWSRQPEELCADLVGKFPDGVAVLSTFGKGETKVHRNGLANVCRDYSISFPGPTRHFAAEARAAGEHRRKLYAMANTGGLTWDYGVMPYLPTPYQWKRRWDALVKANGDWNLSGLMESHHFGWYPSFIAELAKEAYTEGGEPFDSHIRALAARDFGAANVEGVLSVWRQWSAAADDYVAINENQYGPFRIGPAFPYNFGGEPVREGEFPQDPKATHTMRWMAYLNYPYDQAAADSLNVVYNGLSPDERSLELDLLSSIEASWRTGAESLARMAASLSGARRQRADEMVRLGEWHARTAQTALNVKRGYAAFARGDRAEMLQYARREYENARAALKLAEADSRLGYEPSMEYAAGPDQIRWKLQRMENLYGSALRP